MNIIKKLCLSAVIPVGLLCASGAGATLPVKDPLNSPMWEYMAQQYFADESVAFSDDVSVVSAGHAEDSMNVPIMVDASKLDDVQEILVFADLNPITTVLRFYPNSMQPKIGFRVKVQQGTPIRAAVKTTDGRWHVGGTWINAAGGGCTAPSVGSGNADWASRLGETSGRFFANHQDEGRMRFRVMHPMDTGLADGIPAFYLENIKVSDAEGNEVGVIMPFEPVAENPVFTVNTPGEGPVTLTGRDNNGNSFKAEIAR